MTETYDQPEKTAVRQVIWQNAVGILTGNRQLAPLVQQEELAETISYALDILNFSGKERAVIEDEYERWSQSFLTAVGVKKPEELRVLYLCGPEPMNDLNEMIAHGVNPHNVWAVEGSNQDFAAAVKQLANSGTPLKIHRGNLTDFFSLYSSSFDIVYFDACGPFLGGKPSTFQPLSSIMLNARLEPLSVFITNFAEVPDEQIGRYAKLMSSYYRFRYRDLPSAFWNSNLDPAICVGDDRELAQLIQKDCQPFYSDFITRFIVDLARSFFPSCRALANRDVALSHHADRKTLNEVMANAERVPLSATSIEEWLDEAGDLLLNSSGYPLLSFLRILKRDAPNDPLVSQLGNLKVGGQEAYSLMTVAALLDKVMEGHWKMLSRDLLEALRLSWFDRKNHFSCDVPMPNLLINSLLGVYGRPYFPNPRASTRFQYRAKKTMMFTDLLTLDQCRYFFDWFPVVQMAPERFKSVPFQIVARCILDRIGRADWQSDSHPFRYAAVAGQGEISSAKFYDFAARRMVQ